MKKFDEDYEKYSSNALMVCFKKGYLKELFLKHEKTADKVVNNFLNGNIKNYAIS